MEMHYVVAGYIFHKSKVLLIHHGKLDLWLPVGGHIEDNETPDDALVREILEETGLKIEALQKYRLPNEGNIVRNLAVPFNVNVHNVGSHNHCCFFYACRALNANELKTNGEVKSFEWFSKKDLEKEHIPKDVRNMALLAFELFPNDIA